MANNLRIKIGELEKIRNAMMPPKTDSDWAGPSLHDEHAFLAKQGAFGICQKAKENCKYAKDADIFDAVCSKNYYECKYKKG